MSTKIIKVPYNTVLFHVNCWKVFWNIFIWNSFRNFCFKFVNFNTIYKQITVCSIMFALKLIEYIFFAVNECSSNPCVGPSPRIKMSFFILNMNRWTHIYSKDYCVITKTISWMWKNSFSIKSSAISKIFTLINISIFG